MPRAVIAVSTIVIGHTTQGARVPEISAKNQVRATTLIAADHDRKFRAPCASAMLPALTSVTMA
jgi:hypothetical protein